VATQSNKKVTRLISLCTKQTTLSSAERPPGDQIPDPPGGQPFDADVRHRLIGSTLKAEANI
jgi:hypothetical protein